MKIFRAEKQKDNLAKFFWDIAKVALTIMTLGPLAQPSSLKPTETIFGLVPGALMCLCGYILDGIELKR